MENWQEGDFGLYLHWPFCQSKCPYCDFNSHVAATIDEGEWRAAYLSELNRVARRTDDRVLQTVFLGGGTPSLMSSALVADILGEITKLWRISNDFEVTLEANPSSVEARRFAGYRDAGVNRVSLGVQALNDTDLLALGRLHTADEAHRALRIARDTFDRVSFDLIYARQDQTIEAWSAELDAALSYASDHLSLYQLTIEPGTAFARRFAAGGLPGLPDEDLSADLYELTLERCAARGLLPYEVSNFAMPGSESRHNLIYWRSGDYLGIGPGAHGRLSLDGGRYATAAHRMPTQWLQAVREKGSGDLESETLSVEDQAIEALMMGLRLTEGVDLLRLQRQGVRLPRLDALCDASLLAFDGHILRATAQGRMVLNSLVSELTTDLVCEPPGTLHQL